MVSAYVPDRGDLIWLQFDPQAGREQARHLPALVLSPARYNRFGLAIVCPITSRAKGYPWEVSLPDGLAVSGVVLSDQLKSVDWSARKAQLKAKAPSAVLDDVLAKIAPLLAL